MGVVERINQPRTEQAEEDAPEEGKGPQAEDPTYVQVSTSKYFKMKPQLKIQTRVMNVWALWERKGLNHLFRINVPGSEQAEGDGPQPEDPTAAVDEADPPRGRRWRLIR